MDVDVEDGRVREARDGREEIELNFESWIEGVLFPFPFPFELKIEPWEKEGRGGLTVTGPPSFFSVLEFSAFLAFLLVFVFVFVFEEDVMLNIEEALR